MYKHHHQYEQQQYQQQPEVQTQGTTCPPRNCDEVLEKFHELVKEGRHYHQHSDEIARYTLEEINKAICHLEESLKLAEKGSYTLGKAIKYYEYSGCQSTCNINDPRCQHILDDMRYYYSNEAEKKVESLEALKEAAKYLELALDFDKKGDTAFDDYTKCIHHHGNDDHHHHCNCCKCCKCCKCCCRPY